MVLSPAFCSVPSNEPGTIIIMISENIIAVGHNKLMETIPPSQTHITHGHGMKGNTTVLLSPSIIRGLIPQGVYMIQATTTSSNYYNTFGLYSSGSL